MGRRQCVKINGVLSSWIQVSSGVPQGSILGPLLFSLYVNELPSLVSSQLLMFCRWYKALSYHLFYCLVLQNDINILLDWSKRWLLSFNILKCKVLHTGNVPYTGNYTIAGIQLELLDNIRDLGIQIDSKLKFHIHTDMVVKKAYRILGLISGADPEFRKRGGTFLKNSWRPKKLAENQLKTKKKKKKRSQQ